MSSPVNATSSAKDSGRRVPSRVPPTAGEQSTLDLGQPEASSVGRHHEVAGQSTVRSHHPRRRRSPRRSPAWRQRSLKSKGEEPMRSARGPSTPPSLPGALRALAEGAEVHAGAEDPVTRPGEDEHLGAHRRSRSPSKPGPAPASSSGLRELAASGRFSRQDLDQAVLIAFENHGHLVGRPPCRATR